MRILLVEDNDDHALLTTRALRRAEAAAGEPLHVTRAADGAQALAYLRGAGPDGGGPPPDLLLLDLQLPLISGLEVLKILRADPQRRLLPVVVLSTSRHEDDIRAAYGVGANQYVVKPEQPDEFRTKVQAIPVYWARVAQRPS